MIRSQISIGRKRAVLSLLLFSIVTVASIALPERARAQASAEPVRVLIAVVPFRVHSAKPLGYLESSLADLLSARLESSGRVEVLDSLVVREAVVEYAAGELTETALRRLGAELGAEYVVTGSLTELAGRFSFDVRVTPASSAVASESMVLTAGGEDELLDRVNDIADRVLSIVGVETKAEIAEVRIEPQGFLPPEVMEELLTRPGTDYNADLLDRDALLLSRRPEVATVTVETERRPEGVFITFRAVPAQALFGRSSIAEEDAGDVIAEIHVRGHRRIEADAIRARIETRAGDAYRSAQIAADVREVFSLGFFRNVRVYSEDSPDGRIVVFEVEENPVVRRITITGNDNIDNEKIRDSLTLTTGSTLDYPLLFENQARIKALYRAEGYYLADVEYEIDPIADEAVAINFEVDENDKLRLKRIEFTGNNHFSDEELVEGFQTKIWRWYSHVSRFLDNSGTYAEPIFDQDLRGVADKYANAGYLQVQVGEPRVQALDEGLVVVVDIVEGRLFNVGNIEVSGDPTADLEALDDHLLLKQGDVFNRSFLTADVERLEQRYTDNGFFFAKVTPFTAITEEEDAVNVNYTVEKGELYFIRDIEISGNTTTVDEVLRREMQMVEGQLYSARSIRISQQRLESLGFFEEVNFETQPTDDPDRLDLDVKVVEKPTGSLSFGAGFSSLDSFVVNGSISQANLFGRGYGIQASADIGGTADRFYLSFSNPYVLGTTFGFNATAFRTDVEFEDFNEEQQGISLALSHILDPEARSRGFLRYDWSSRKVEQDSGVNAASLIFREVLNGEESTSLLGVSFRSDTRDDRVVPSSGMQLGFSSEFAGLGGFSKFIRNEGRISLYAPAPEWLPFRSTFSFTARAGWAIPFNDVSDFDLPDENTASSFERGLLGLEAPFLGLPTFNVAVLGDIDDDLKLPLTERYFLGGLGTFQLRGYRARSVGPRRAILWRPVLGGALGSGSVFSPVGFLNGTCQDGTSGIQNTQGDGDGKCNNLDDQDIDDFDDLDETDVIGGNKFVSLSFEQRFPISTALGLVGIVFLDMGNAFSEEESVLEIGKWRYGAGFGALWFSPFGPLEGFIGFPLNALEVEDSVVFEFSVGGSSF